MLELVLYIAIFGLATLAIVFGKIASLAQAAKVAGQGVMLVLLDIFLCTVLSKVQPPPKTIDVLMLADTSCFPLLIVVGYGLIVGAAIKMALLK